MAIYDLLQFLFRRSCWIGEGLDFQALNLPSEPAGNSILSGTAERCLFMMACHTLWHNERKYATRGSLVRKRNNDRNSLTAFLPPSCMVSKNTGNGVVKM